MRKSLWVRVCFLFLFVSAIALSSSLILRYLIVDDFRKYHKSEMEDRVYWVTTDLEGTFEKYSGWRENIIAEDVVWALLLGFETRVRNRDGSIVMGTERAINSLPLSTKQKVLTVSGFKPSGESGKFVSYPLFIGGKEIGLLEVKFLDPAKEELFARRSNRFLLISFFFLGGLAVGLSIIFSRKLTDPIKKLAAGADAIGQGNLGIRVDIKGEDELGRLAQTFNRMTETLEIQNSLRKKLCSNAAHELRTPLCAIRGELEGMMDGLIPTGREQLQSLYDETSRLTGILEGMEELLQAEASVLSLKKQTLQLQPFLHSIVDRYGTLFWGNGVALELESDDQGSVYADPDRLSQIIINLLGNALKATGAGGRVLIKTGKRAGSSFVEIDDTGCGIKEDELPFIFERFYRGAQGGLGLGLTIVRELVEAHGGRIEVTSEVGKGSSFTVYLPEV